MVITVQADAEIAIHTVSVGAPRSIGGLIPPDAQATGPGRVSTTPGTPVCSITARTRSIALSRRRWRRGIDGWVGEGVTFGMSEHGPAVPCYPIRHSPVCQRRIRLNDTEP